MKSKNIPRRDFLLSSGVAATGVGLVSRVKAGVQAGTGASGKPAILGGTPVRSAPFPDWPVIEAVDETEFLKSLQRKEWCRLYGETTTTFEEKWAAGLGARHAIGVVNGTNALYAALSALDVGPGDEVIVPPYTFVATINAVIQQFALPVFVDTDPVTFEMDVSNLEAAVNENTRCILPVHIGGNVANMDRILEVSRRRKIPVVEDACQAHFAEWKGKKVGSVGDIGCFSFQSTKILPCGEGGAVVTSSEELYDRLHAFQNNGRDRTTGTRNGYLHQGTNLRMTEFQSALLLAQFSRFEEQCRRREENANHLIRLLSEIPGIEPAGMYDGCTRNTYYIFMARYVPEQFGGLPRAKFQRAMRQEGIPVGSGYQPLNKEPFLKKSFETRAYKRLFGPERMERYWKDNVLPKNDRLCEEGIFLSHTYLLGEKSDVEQIVEAISRIAKHAGEIAAS